jgi:uncharacterized membrane protein YdjX (TVP38/TMEM64 family)
MSDIKKFKTVLLVFWAMVLIIILVISLTKGISPEGALNALTKYIKDLGIWGPLVYVAFYSIRSLVFFPASLLTISAGALFGPVQGLLLTLIGENISANISFVISRYFKANILEHFSPSANIAAKISCYSKENGLILVMISRLIFLPFDLVSYSSGLSCIRQKDFALGTFIGTIPGLLTYTLLGSSLLDVRFLAMSALSLALSLLLASYLKRRGPVMKVT